MLNHQMQIKGKSTVDDWELLLTRQPSNVTNLYEFEDSTRLFYSNEQVGNYYHEQLTKLGLPIAHINARHSSAVAKKISSDDMSGLEPVVFLAKDASLVNHEFMVMCWPLQWGHWNSC